VSLLFVFCLSVLSNGKRPPTPRDDPGNTLLQVRARKLQGSNPVPFSVKEGGENGWKRQETAPIGECWGKSLNEQIGGGQGAFMKYMQARELVVFRRQTS
jgi:hypothetical protein